MRVFYYYPFLPPVAAPHRSSAETPVMRQFLEIKSRYPDAVLMFRMGDFYELFFEDAVTVAPVLDIALTSRDRDAENAVPMAGVPYHAIGGYLRTLVERGYKVAICEQMETPEQARKRRGSKIVHREVVRVVTPGALVDEEHLRGNEPNFLAALVPERSLPGAAGIAALDISSGEFCVTRARDGSAILAELARLAPREILAPQAAVEWLTRALAPHEPRVEVREPTEVPAAARERARVLAEDSGVAPLCEATLSATALTLAYAEATQPGQTLLLGRLRRHELGEHLVLDSASLRNLEVFRTIRGGERRGSLLWAIDATRTTMGARMLRGWLGAPERDPDELARRQDGIAALLEEPTLREDLQTRLRDVRDVARLAARARLGRITPRELGALRDSLAALPGLRELLEELGTRRTDGTVPALLGLGSDVLSDVHTELCDALVDDPPAITREGGIIRSGADPDLDEQRGLRDGGRDALAAIERRERERTKIATLRVQHNRVFGYYLEVPKAHLARVPSDYVRKQTLVNAERYVTEELAEHEAAVLGAQANALARELELFATLRERVSEAGARLAAVAERIATLDVLGGLAEVAQRHRYARPEIVAEPVLEIVDGRHPVVERMLETGGFVPNGVTLRAGGGGEDEARLWIVTGPNMGGKSTILRQAALIVILAQIGSYVPAARARIGLVDRVFTRVGAADDLGAGASTFMVEMREAANILAEASRHSLVVLDEIGRGTATYDGLALAWAIVEFLHDQVGCRALFATHYHELCDLEQRLAGVCNVHVSVAEQRGRIVFLHRVEAGPAGRSYGIHVGRLAGLPARVLRRASRILERLEAADRTGSRDQLDLFAPRAEPMREGSGETDSEGDLILDELRDLDPDELTPRAAHEVLRAWVDRLRSG